MKNRIKEYMTNKDVRGTWNYIQKEASLCLNMRNKPKEKHV